MGLNLVIDKQADGPLYRRIADGILRDIYSGKLPAGYQLPTVRELADEMGLSKGTVRHAYEYLTRAGVIEMTQGKGSFVLGVEEETSSRKEKAMAAFDELFASLGSLGFTPREMSIYFKLKMQGLEESYDFVKAAVVDCNPETIRLIEKQLSEIGYVETAGFSLEQVGEVARKLNGEYDLVLTTSTHFAEVEAVVRDTSRMAMMAMRPTTRTIIQLARMDAGEQVGMAAASRNFVEIMRNGCQDMGPWSREIPAYLFGESRRFADFLDGLTTVILPEGYRAFVSEKELSALGDFEDIGGRILLYDYAIDRGSFIYVKELITRCLNRKRSL